MTALPLTLRPRPFEPGHGLLLRLGARNGVRSARHFARSFGLDYRQVLTGGGTSVIVAAAGLPAAATSWNSPHVQMPERRVSICGETLAVGDWSTATRRYCPICLGFDIEQARALKIEPAWYAAHRTQWDVRSVTTCRQHRILLRDACHRCTSPLRWTSTDLLRCANCKANLAAAPCEESHDPLADYLTDRLAGAENANLVLDPLPLYQVVDLCERLGQIELIGALPSLPRQTFADLTSARRQGFVMTRDLEKSVTRSLDRAMQRGDVPSGLLGAYGWIYGEWLALDDTGTGIIRPILLKHAVQHGVISADEPRLGNTPPSTISMTRAARELGMGYKQARRAAEAADIIPTGSRRGVAFTLDPDIVSLLKQRSKQGFTPRAAAASLRTGKRQIADLLEAGLIEANSEGRIVETSIEQLMRSLDMQCCSDRSPENLVDLGSAARNASVPLAKICKAAAAGKLPCWRSAGSGLSAYLVRLCDIVALRMVPKQLTIEEAAGRIGVHKQCAAALARCGTLAGAGKRVSEQGLRHFSENYVVGAQLAKSLGRSPRALQQDLMSRGIAPAFDLTTHRQAIYYRADLHQHGQLQ